MSRVRVMSTDGFVLGTIETKGIRPDVPYAVFMVREETMIQALVRSPMAEIEPLLTVTLRGDKLHTNDGWNTERFLVLQNMSEMGNLLDIPGFERAERIVHWNGYGGTRCVWTPERGGQWEDRPAAWRDRGYIAPRR